MKVEKNKDGGTGLIIYEIMSMHHFKKSFFIKKYLSRKGQESKPHRRNLFSIISSSSSNKLLEASTDLSGY